jgi:hypothetical protein
MNKPTNPEAPKSTSLHGYPYMYSRLSPGDLVRVVNHEEIIGLNPNSQVGMIMEWYDSDVYKSARARVLIDDNVYTYDARNLDLIGHSALKPYLTEPIPEDSP